MRVVKFLFGNRRQDAASQDNKAKTQPARGVTFFHLATAVPPATRPPECSSLRSSGTDPTTDPVPQPESVQPEPKTVPLRRPGPDKWNASPYRPDQVVTEERQATKGPYKSSLKPEKRSEKSIRAAEKSAAKKEKESRKAINDAMKRQEKSEERFGKALADDRYF